MSGEWAFADAFKLGAGISRDKFHREITNWDTTSCATDGGTPRVPPVASAPPRWRPREFSTREWPFPTPSLRNYMQAWTHGPLYETSDFDVGVNNGWALPNYAALDPATNIDYFENELARGLVGGLNVAGYNPRVLDEEYRRNVPDGQRSARDARQPALQHRRALHPDRPVRLGIHQREHARRVRCASMSKAPPTTTRCCRASTWRANLGHGLVLRAAASKTMTRAQPGDIAPNQSLSINGDVLTIGKRRCPYFADNFDLGSSGTSVNRARHDRGERLDEGDRGLHHDRRNVTPFGQLGIDYATLPTATQVGIRNTANAQCGCTTGNPLNAQRARRSAPEHQ